MADKKKPNRDTVLRDLGNKLGKAMVRELLAQRKYQDALQITQGARTPTTEDRNVVAAAKQGWLARSRERIQILTQMEDLLGIVHKPGKSARERLDQLPDDPT